MKLLFLKSEKGSVLLSNGILLSSKVYCIQRHNEDIKKTSVKGCFSIMKRKILKRVLIRLYRKEFNSKREGHGDFLSKILKLLS